MDATVSFDQFCPVAVSLDALGDRWAVLLMRDLLWAGPQSRVGLLERNPGLDEETLSSALDRLRVHDLVQQLDEPKRRYNLTEKGEGIGDVIRALFNFGMPLLGDVVVNDWMLSYPIADCSRRKRFDLLEVEERVLVQMKVDKADKVVELSPGLLRVVQGQEPQAAVVMSGGTLASLLGGGGDAAQLEADQDIEITGDRNAVEVLLAVLPADH